MCVPISVLFLYSLLTNVTKNIVVTRGFTKETRYGGVFIILRAMGFIFHFLFSNLSVQLGAQAHHPESHAFPTKPARLNARRTVLAY